MRTPLLTRAALTVALVGVAWAAETAALVGNQTWSGVVRVEGSRLDRAGLDLVSLEDSPVTLRGNEFGRAGRDAVRLKGTLDVAASGNFWGTATPAQRIHDGQDDATLGRVTWEPALGAPPPLAVPFAPW